MNYSINLFEDLLNKIKNKQGIIPWFEIKKKAFHELNVISIKEFRKKLKKLFASKTFASYISLDKMN